MVAIEHEATKKWSIHGKVVQQVAPISYEIQLPNGRKMRRNQCFMRKRHINFAVIRGSSPCAVVLPLERTVEEQEGIEDRDSSDEDTMPYNQSDSDTTEQSWEEEISNLVNILWLFRYYC